MHSPQPGPPPPLQRQSRRYVPHPSRGHPVTHSHSHPLRQDEELLRGWHADAFRKHIVVLRHNPLKQSSIDRDQHPESRSAILIDQGQQLIRRSIVNLAPAQPPAPASSASTSSQPLDRTTCKQLLHLKSARGQILQRKVDPPTLRIFTHVPQDIRQLKRNAGLLRQLLRSRIAISKDPNANQPHDRSNKIAISIQPLEVLIHLQRLRSIRNRIGYKNHTPPATPRGPSWYPAPGLPATHPGSQTFSACRSTPRNTGSSDDPLRLASRHASSHSDITAAAQLPASSHHRRYHRPAA